LGVRGKLNVKQKRKCIKKWRGPLLAGHPFKTQKRGVYRDQGTSLREKVQSDQLGAKERIFSSKKRWRGVESGLRKERVSRTDWEGKGRTENPGEKGKGRYIQLRERKTGRENWFWKCERK